MHDSYASPFSWRYGSQEMRAVWSERSKRLLWRRIWLALARAEHDVGLVSAEQLADLARTVEDVDLVRAEAIEAEIHHDLMAEVRTWAEQCPVGGGIIHLGATSADIEDNADVLRVRSALALLVDRLRGLCTELAEQIERWADTPTMAFTHIQPAEPTTIGYRLAQYGQDLLGDLEALEALRARIRGKGLKGACGTSASYHQLLAGTGRSPAELEAAVLAELALEAWPVATQTYPRKQDYDVLCALAGLAQSLSRLAFDLRVLQSPAFGELAEPFGAHQVGSSAMPFKRNPIHAENLTSLGRHVAALPRVAWDNAAQGVLERTLDDSANRRIVLPEAFLAADEMLRRATRIIAGLRVDTGASEKMLATWGVFAATERLLMEAVRRGGDRQALHEVLRQHALAAWEALRRGEQNPLAEALVADARLSATLTAEETAGLLDARTYVGDAPERARTLASRLRAVATRSAAVHPR